MKYLLLILYIFLIIPIKGISQNVPALIQKILPCVVLVQSEYGIGSGVIISKQGYILTNYHVIIDAHNQGSSITIKTHNKDVYRANVISHDEDLDICLLKIQPLEIEYVLPIANPDSVKVGEDVICIGNPFGVSDYVTKGIISKFNTPDIFTTASINPGNSGGALVNLKGELVGIPTKMLKDAQNFNVSICPRTIRYFLKKNKIYFKD